MTEEKKTKREEKKPLEKATFDDIIRLKLRREKANQKKIELPIESLGKTLTFVSPDKDVQLDFINDIRKSGGLSGAYDAYRAFVYACCPMLHSGELQKELDVVDPPEIVDRLFSPMEVYNLGDRLADEFMGALTDDIKN